MKDKTISIADPGLYRAAACYCILRDSSAKFGEDGWCDCDGGMMSFGGWGFRVCLGLWAGGRCGSMREMIDGEEVEGGGFGKDCESKGTCILTASVKKGDKNYGKISIDHRYNMAGWLILG